MDGMRKKESIIISGLRGFILSRRRKQEQAHRSFQPPIVIARFVMVSCTVHAARDRLTSLELSRTSDGSDPRLMI